MSPATQTATAWWLLEATDTWFFRDGAAYDKGTPWQSAVSSHFPPSPRVVSGAVRAALARASGWSGGPWDQSTTERFGDWPDDPGELSVLGPFLSLDGKPLFPAPGHLLVEPNSSAPSPQERYRAVGFLSPAAELDDDEEEEDEQERYRAVGFLSPGEPVHCDLGRVALPTPILQGTEHNPKSAAGLWIDAAGLAKVLSGELPEPHSLVGSETLFAREARVGLEMVHRDVELEHVTGDVKLYSPLHIRPLPGVGLLTGLVHAGAVPMASPLTLGGEGRMASATLAQTGPQFPAAQIPAGSAFALVQLTPALFQGDSLPTIGQPLPGPDGPTLISAVCERAYGIGGWDGRRRRPLPLRPSTPSGSVWFCEGTVPIPDEDGFVRIGDDNAHGFGLFLLAQLPRSNS